MDETQENVAAMWERYCSTREKGLREQIVLHYAPLVKRVVSRLGISESATLDYHDLISHGTSGLLEAVDRFDPQRGIAFETFASQRIRGSVLDALRDMDFVSRTVRRRSNEIEEAVMYLRGQLGRAPLDEEVAQHLSMDIQTYRDVLNQINIVFLSLDSPLSSSGGDGDLILSEALEDPAMQDVMGEIEEQDLRMQLIEAIRELPEREQLVLSLYYYEELTVREVAEVMSLSPSRISQLLARAIMLLRTKMAYGMSATDSRRRPRQTTSPAFAHAAVDGKLGPGSAYKSYARGRI